MNSKKLSNKDESGDLFSEKIFDNSQYKELTVDFDRISFNYKENSWIIIDHILVDTDISTINELATDKQQKIKNILNFTNHLKNISGKDVSVYIDLYFDTNHKNKNKILLLDEQNNFHPLKLDEYAMFFREINFYCNESNLNKEYKGHYINVDDINKIRADDSAFSISKACLSNDVTYGFNLDKLLYNDKTKEVYIFELLLCEEAQSVTPWTSHPNKYFNKNSMKFINLHKFSSELRSNLYLINYAKPETKAGNQILFMKVLTLDEKNIKLPLKTEDKKINLESLRKGLATKILKNTNPVLKIGKKFNNS